MKNDLQNQPKSVVDAISEIMKNTLEEGKSSTGYELFHKTLGSAIDTAIAHAKKKFGITITDDERMEKVGMGPRKPSSGKTNSYRLMGTDKNGKTKGVQVQVANLDNKRYELNMYKESIDEGKNLAQQAAIAIAKKESGKYDKDGKKIKKEADPCWDGYKQVGMKKGKNGAMVPNCVPEETVVEEPKNCGCGKTPCETYGDVDENKKAALAKKLAKASASTQKGKEKVTLKKAPWDKKSEAYKPVKSGHYDVKVTVSSKDVNDVKDYIMNSRQYNDGDIEDVDSDQVDGGGMKFKGTGDIFIQGDGAGKLGMEISKKFRGKVKVLGEEINEASKEGTIRIINLGDRRQDKIRKELGVDGLPNKGFQVQRMTKGKFVNQGKPYKSQKDAEKVRKDGQHSMQFEAKMSQDQINKLKKGYESLRGKKISPEMGMKLSKELEKLDKDAAIQIAKADIPFVSTLAVNKLIMNFNMSGAAIKKVLGESVEIEELVEKIEGLKKKSEKSGVAYGILKKVYDRGMAAWKSGHRPGTTPQQWAFARVNSFLTGGGARKADNDLWSKHKGKSPKKEGTTMKKFSNFINEAEGGLKMVGAAGELEKYSKKSGGIDKKDFMKAVKLMRTGMSSKLVSFTNDLDTEPREKIIDVVANHLGVKATEKMFGVKFLNRKEEVEIETQIDEGKMKDLSVDVDNVYKGMQKNFVMKSFADKFKKDVAKSMNIRKSLEKILPDYVAGKDIQKLMASHCKDLNASHCVSEDEFKPHTMWDPKTGKAYMAKTHDDHIRMGKMGYTHKDPKEEELSAKQKKIDLNKNGKVDGDDLAKLRNKKESATNMRNMKLINKIKKSGVVKKGSMSKEDLDISSLIENADKKDAKEMADVVKELDPKVKSAELKKRVYDMAMEKYKNKMRANKIAGMV